MTPGCVRYSSPYWCIDSPWSLVRLMLLAFRRRNDTWYRSPWRWQLPAISPATANVKCAMLLCHPAMTSFSKFFTLIMLYIIALGYRSHCVWILETVLGRQTRVAAVFGFPDLTRTTFELRLFDDFSKLQESENKARMLQVEVERLQKEMEDMRRRKGTFMFVTTECCRLFCCACVLSIISNFKKTNNNLEVFTLSLGDPESESRRCHHHPWPGA